LQAAAPEVFAQINEQDAERLGIANGEMVLVSSSRGSVKAKARVGGIIPGHIFIPFHYGYWDSEDGHSRAANELTASQWDPVSKQPYFKTTSVALSKAEGAAGIAAKVKQVAAEAVDQTLETADKLAAAAHIPRKRIADAMALVVISNENFINACRVVKTHHFENAEICNGLNRAIEISEESLRRLDPWVKKFGKHSPSELTRLATSMLPPVRAGMFGLLRDLQNLATAISEVHVLTISLQKASRAIGDAEFVHDCNLLEEGCKRQVALCLTYVEHHAAAAIVTKY
jgi:formylmethanofuran dehydrogenase subunit D